MGGRGGGAVDHVYCNTVHTVLHTLVRKGMMTSTYRSESRYFFSGCCSGASGVRTGQAVPPCWGDYVLKPVVILNNGK
jgi:hypothetical protein